MRFGAPDAVRRELRRTSGNTLAVFVAWRRLLAFRAVRARNARFSLSNCGLLVWSVKLPSDDDDDDGDDGDDGDGNADDSHRRWPSHCLGCTLA